MRLLIVESDATSAQFFKHLSEQQDGIVEVGVTDSVQSTLRYIGQKAPDLLVLEAELGSASGFDVLRSLCSAATPAIVISKCEQHAFKAFRMGAVDYLLKPVTASQFLTALQRAQRLRISQQSHESPVLPSGSSPAKGASSRLVGERSNRYYFIAVDDVDFIEAYGNYVKIHVGTEQYLRRDTLRRLAEALRDNGFRLVRRSMLVNLKRVTSAEKCAKGALAFNLSSGTRLVSRIRFKFDGSALSSEKLSF
jgi:two-component system, LytTR family, response regulator